MKFLVFGASGRIGRSIVVEALERGHDVTAGVRTPGKLSVSHPQLTVVRAQIDDVSSVESAVRGHDAVIDAVGGLGHDNPRIAIDCMAPLIRGMSNAGVLRLLVVGTAGTLEVPGGGLRKDQPDFPDRLKVEAQAHEEVLFFLRQFSPEVVRWTYFSPPAQIGDGERTHNILLGKDELLFDKDGNSSISYPDYAAAVIDELVHPRHIGSRFTAISA